MSAALSRQPSDQPVDRLLYDDRFATPTHCVTRPVAVVLREHLGPRPCIQGHPSLRCQSTRQFISTMSVCARRHPVFTIAEPIKDAALTQPNPGRPVSGLSPALDCTTTEMVAIGEFALGQIDFRRHMML